MTTVSLLYRQDPEMDPDPEDENSYEHTIMFGNKFKSPKGGLETMGLVMGRRKGFRKR